VALSVLPGVFGLYSAAMPPSLITPHDDLNLTAIRKVSLTTKRYIYFREADKFAHLAADDKGDRGSILGRLFSVEKKPLFGQSHAR